MIKLDTRINEISQTQWAVSNNQKMWDNEVNKDARFAVWRYNDWQISHKQCRAIRETKI